MYLNRHNAVLNVLAAKIWPACRRNAIDLAVDLPRSGGGRRRQSSSTTMKTVAEMFQDVIPIKTRQRPDMILYDPHARSITVAELTCCRPGKGDYWAKEKRYKYADMIRAIRKETGSTTSLWTIEIDSDGKNAHGLRPFLLGPVRVRDADVLAEIEASCMREVLRHRDADF